MIFHQKNEKKKKRDHRPRAIGKFNSFTEKNNCNVRMTSG